MRELLAKWMSDADAVRHIEYFGMTHVSVDLAYVRAREDDFYLSLVGELFERMRQDYDDGADWARLGNALSEFAVHSNDRGRQRAGIAVNEALLFAAAAFYCGGYPASAYLMIQGRTLTDDTEAYRACFDLLARPAILTSRTGDRLMKALRQGDLRTIDAIERSASRVANESLTLGPTHWIPARLLETLIKRFGVTNIRRVLPDGGSEFWNPMVMSLLDRRPPVWMFFPSQIKAIQRGLLEQEGTYSLQMPTGAGKTALCETLLYWHLRHHPEDAAVLLVPYRSLASELRATLVKRMNAMGISARCAYGGTVPLGDEVHELENTHALVATPEALSGLLGADPNFFRRISLVVCDEGHLLDGGGRGLGLELLLARMKAREAGAPRFVFVSAIVPNIEEINAWLGGTSESVVRSDYRPALAEFSVLRRAGSVASSQVTLDMHPHEAPPTRFSVEGFLARSDFQWRNPVTGRINTLPFSSVKTLAIAAARKALRMGAVAVFAANKHGNQGAVGLAEELLTQLSQLLPLPSPLDFVRAGTSQTAVEYLKSEFGSEWVGTQALAAGAVLHHGDIPQETREVLEDLVRQRHLQFAICTTTLAEGVNLPIRTLVLYSVQRRQKGGRTTDLLARDIKNLVGRAGRAGATTKGLVICANEKQWPLVERVARNAAGEPVTGALRALVGRLKEFLAVRDIALTNQFLELSTPLHTMIDGIDATLIDLAAEEIGEEDLVRLAVQLADQTFASRQADSESKTLLRDVFKLRARKVVEIRTAGRIRWIRETGARVRMLDLVERELLPKRLIWDDVADPIDTALVGTLIEWAWIQGEMQEAVRETYQLEEDADTSPVKESFVNMVNVWLYGGRFVEIAARSQLTVDKLLRVHAGAQLFVLQTIIEQGIALLSKLLESQGKSLAPAILQFPEHLRFGVPTEAARILASEGVRHRRAAVDLGTTADLTSIRVKNKRTVCSTAKRLLMADRESWITPFRIACFCQYSGRPQLSDHKGWKEMHCNAGCFRVRGPGAHSEAVSGEMARVSKQRLGSADLSAAGQNGWNSARTLHRGRLRLQRLRFLEKWGPSRGSDACPVQRNVTSKPTRVTKISKTFLTAAVPATMVRRRTCHECHRRDDRRHAGLEPSVATKILGERPRSNGLSKNNP